MGALKAFHLGHRRLRIKNIFIGKSNDKKNSKN